jgi:hypothetical protein
MGPLDSSTAICLYDLTGSLTKSCVFATRRVRLHRVHHNNTGGNAPAYRQQSQSCIQASNEIGHSECSRKKWISFRWWHSG